MDRGNRINILILQGFCLGTIVAHFRLGDGGRCRCLRLKGAIQATDADHLKKTMLMLIYCGLLNWGSTMKKLSCIKRCVEKFNRELTATVMLVGLLLAGYSEAATVYSCAGSGERCVVRLEEGMVGDQVRILDEKARPIASGRIIKRRGNFALVSVTNSSQTVRKGYPVIVNIDSRSSSLQWAASFTNQD